MEERNEINNVEKKKISLIDNYPIGFPTDRISRIESILNESIANIKV